MPFPAPFLRLFFPFLLVTAAFAAPPASIDPIIRKYELADYRGLIADADAYLRSGGVRSPRLQSLLVRAHFELGDFINAKIELLRFKKLHAGPANSGSRSLLRLEAEIDKKVAELEKSWAGEQEKTKTAEFAAVESSIARETKATAQRIEALRTEEAAARKRINQQIDRTLADYADQNRVFSAPLPSGDKGILLFSANGALAAWAPDHPSGPAVDSSHSIKVWDVSRREQVASLDLTGVEYLAKAAFSPDGRFLVADLRWPYKTERQTVRIWDSRLSWKLTDLKIKRDKKDRSNPGRLTLSPDSSLFAVYGDRAQLYVWSLSQNKLLKKFGFGHPNIWEGALHLSPSNLLLSCAPTERSSYLTDAATGKADQTIPTPDYIERAIFSPDGQWIATTHRDNPGLFIASTSGKTPSRHFATPTQRKAGKSYDDGIDSFSFSPDSQTIACRLRSGVIQVWNIALGTLLAHTTSAYSLTTLLRHTADGRHLYLMTGREVICYDALTLERQFGDLLYDIDDKYFSEELSADARFLLARRRSPDPKATTGEITVWALPAINR